VINQIKDLNFQKLPSFSTHRRVRGGAPVGTMMLTALCFLSGATVSLRTPFRTAQSAVRVRMVATEAEPATTMGTLKRDRYVATNQFTVRPGAEAKFEARWANRKSRLATLDGFKYFNLMRRVTLDGGAPPDAEDPFGYVSLTIWETKQDFNTWRTGDAFKEAHGGTSIGAFLGAMISSLRVLKGAPRPVFYDGLMQLSAVPTSLPKTEGGWRVVEADGVNLLPAEAFIACNRFSVLPGMEAAFEQRWAARESKLDDCEGFVSFSMLRRDYGNKGHGSGPPPAAGEFNYQSCTVWRDRSCFMKWRDSQQFRSAHGGDKPAPAAEAPKPPPMWAGPPTPVFYEGVLCLSSSGGA
jgi:heme-degrading monooxygenase HmoA